MTEIERTAATRREVEAVWRSESARIVAALTRRTGDFSWAEDLAQDALAEALTRWPEAGVPDNPGAWLLAVAQRKAIDGWRRRERLEERMPLMGLDVLEAEAHHPVEAAADPDHIDDDALRLFFVACHPVLSATARLALTLRTVAGLTTEQIAGVLLTSVPAVQQRIVRAKRALGDAAIPFEVPDRRERPARLASVLQAVYLLFTEAYAPADGERPLRVDVAREAVRLARQLRALMPREPEVLGLIALMEFQSSRFPARTDAQGLPLTLAEQDRSRWDRSAIQRAQEALARAEDLTSSVGYYRLQAIAAQSHAEARDFASTDWGRIVAVYDALTEMSDTPIVRLNRAVAVSMRDGADAGLALVAHLEADLHGYRPFHAVRGELLERSGELSAAAEAYRTGADLPGNAAEAAVLRERAQRVSDSQAP